ncbi:hypothetical protein [Ekhidna sp.]
MRKSLIFFCLFSTLGLLGQQYEGVFIEKKDVDADNKLFVSGRSFMYIVTTTIPGEDIPDQVTFTVLDVKQSKRTNKNQTEVVISYDPDNGRYQATGIVENAKNLWLHPPRSSFFEVLETCPFPYVKFPIKDGDVWHEKLKVGDEWSQGKWTGNLLFEISYKVVEEKVVDTEKIKTSFFAIEAEAKSSVGTSKAKFLFNENMGFTIIDFTTLEGRRIHFRLDQTIDGESIKSLEDFILMKR